MAPKIYRSPLPDVDLVETDLPSYVFSNPSNISPDTPLFIDANTGERRTRADVLHHTKCLASGLQNLGVRENDVVILYSPNSIDYATICYAVIGSGAIISPANIALTASELKEQLETSQAKFIVVHSSLQATAENATRGSAIKTIAYGDVQKPSIAIATIEDLISQSQARGLIKIPPSEVANKVAFMCFSSGTTGRAKGVMSTHHNLTSNCQQWMTQHWQVAKQRAPFVAFLPFSHIYGVATYITSSIFTGKTVIVMPKFDLAGYLENIQRYRPKVLHLVPPVALLLAKNPIVEQYDLSSVEIVLSAAAPLSFELSTAVENRLRKRHGTTVHCLQMLGATEASPLISAAPIDSLVKRAGVGFITPNMKFRFVDPDTLIDVKCDSSGQSEPGEIWCRGPNVMKGYFQNDEANQRAFHIDDNGQKWLRMGDIATIDGSGWIEIQDRIKDMIKYKGFQVVPSELEAKLLEHPAVQDCCVIGVWNEQMATELPVGFIVLDSKAHRGEFSSALVESIHEWLNGRVARHKRLRGGIFVVDSIPKSSSGKILRRHMKSLLEKKNDEKMAKL